MRWSVLLSGLWMLVPFLLVRLDYPFSRSVTGGFALNLGVACLLAAPPFTPARIAIALAIRDYPRLAGRGYAARLARAGVGAAAGGAGLGDPGPPAAPAPARAHPARPAAPFGG